MRIIKTALLIHCWVFNWVVAFFFFILFWDRIWNSVDPAGLELTEPCLPQPPKFWHERHATPFPGYHFNFKKKILLTVFKVLFIVILCVWVLSLHLCVPWACRVPASQKSLSLLEQGLQTVVSRPVGAGTRTLVLSAEPSLQPPILASLPFFFFCFFWAFHTAFASIPTQHSPHFNSSMSPSISLSLPWLLLLCIYYVLIQPAESS